MLAARCRENIINCSTRNCLHRESALQKDVCFEGRGVPLKIVPKPVAEDRIEDFISLYIDLRDAADERILSRHRMTMRDVVSYAADMTIVEMVNDDEWIVRLNGTGHCMTANIDRTGENVLATCPPEERAMRREIAEQMFSVPCGLFAVLRQKFEDGSRATLDTTSLPLLGKDGERLILTYGLLVDDIEDSYQDRPVMTGIHVTGHRYVDLGFGVPEEETQRAATC